MELTEKWLMTSAGWQAMKEARRIISAGAVLKASREGNLVQGIVAKGSRQLACGMRIHGKHDVDNLCSCPTSRRSGALCEHSVAVALQSLQPNVITELTEKSKTANNSDILKLELIEYVLCYYIPNTFTKSWEKGTTAIQVEISSKESKISPLGKTKIPTVATGRSDSDTRVLAWLNKSGLEHVPPTLMLNPQQTRQFLEAVTGSSRVFLRGGGGNKAGAEPLRISELPFRRRLVVCRAGDDEVSLENAPLPEGVELLLAKNDNQPSWVYLSGRQTLMPLGGSGAALEQVLGALFASAETPEPVLLKLPWLAIYLDALQDAFTLDDPDGILASVEIRKAAPGVELSLEGSLQNLSAHLTFQYGDLAVTAGASGQFPHRDARDPNVFHIRNSDAEKAAIQHLENLGFGAPDKRGYQHLSGENSVLSFYASALPRLQSRWSVTLGERFQRVTRPVQRVAPSLEFSGNRGGEWLECSLDFDTPSGAKISRNDILRLLQTGKSSSRLPDGTRVAIDLDAASGIDEVLRDCSPDLDASKQVFRMRASQGRYLDASVQYYGGNVKNKEVESGGCPEVNMNAYKFLRSYQNEGVKWILNRSYNDRGAVLADEMGLGKTVQILVFLETWIRHVKTRGSDPATAIVICPTSLLQTWRSEAEKFTPGLKVLVLHGTGRSDHFKGAWDADLVITSYGLLARDVGVYQEVEPFCVAVLDEASYIKNPDTKVAKAARQLPADVRIALTGTPLENSVRDIWSIFEFALPGYLGARKEFEERYEKPISSAADSSAERARLRNRLKPFLLRRLKTAVAKDLPEKIENTVYCDLNAAQSEAYRKILEESQDSIRQTIRKQGAQKARMTMLTALLRLRQTCCDLRLLGLPETEKQEPAGKILALQELIREVREGDHRVLVFSQFVSMLKLLRAEFDNEGLEYCYLDGASTDRGQQVKAFQADPSKRAFLISLKAGGYGLTLTAADTVIHFDPWWNPAVEAQATDRAHRIGQRKTVNVYKLITRGTVEEKILNLQRKKRDVFDVALDDVRPVMGGLTDGDLEEVLDIG